MADLLAYLSHTQVAMFLRCARQYYFRYIMGRKTPPSGALKLGGAYHKAVEFDYVQKIASHTDAAESDLTEYFSDTFESEWSREPVQLDADAGETKGGLKDQGVDLVKEFRRSVAPRVQPVEVERKLEYTFIPTGEDGKPISEQSVKVMGIIDVVDEAGRIRDNKTAGRAPNQLDIDRDMQLSTYALVRRMVTRKVETELTLDVVLKYSRPEARVFTTRRSREMLAMHRNTIGMVAKAIKAEAFPRNPTGWWCSKKFCGYWDDCMGKGLVAVVDLGENLERNLKESLDRGEEKGSEEGRKKGGKDTAQSGQEGSEEIQAAHRNHKRR